MTSVPEPEPHAALDDRRALNLGSGVKRLDEAVNLDVTPDTHPDIVHNLNQYPWPFEDNRFDTVTAFDVIEHLDDISAAMTEIHRISAPGAMVHLTVPHFSSDGAYTDPTHRHYFGAFTFDYFSDGHPLNFYSRVRFKNRSTQIIFRPALVNKLIWRLANRYPKAYEQRWTWIFPAWFLAIQLEVVK